MIPSSIRTVLKFCYLLPFMLGISCGDSPNKIKSDIEKSNLEEDTAKESTDVKTILFFGNSLTAGMGLEPDKAFPRDHTGKNRLPFSAFQGDQCRFKRRNHCKW